MIIEGKNYQTRQFAVLGGHQVIELQSSLSNRCHTYKEGTTAFSELAKATLETIDAVGERVWTTHPCVKKSK